MTSWGVEESEVPRWLFALQSWEFPTTALFSPYLWPGGKTKARGGDLSGYKARWPAPSLGFSTDGCPPTPNMTPTAPPLLPVMGWGLERGRGCPGLPSVHFDPSSSPAWLLADCRWSAS